MGFQQPFSIHIQSDNPINVYTDASSTNVVSDIWTITLSIYNNVTGSEVTQTSSVYLQYSFDGINWSKVIGSTLLVADNTTIYFGAQLGDEYTLLRWVKTLEGGASVSDPSEITTAIVTNNISISLIVNENSNPPSINYYNVEFGLKNNIGSPITISIDGVSTPLYHQGFIKSNIPENSELTISVNSIPAEYDIVYYTVNNYVETLIELNTNFGVTITDNTSIYFTLESSTPPSTKNCTISGITLYDYDISIIGGSIINSSNLPQVVQIYNDTISFCVNNSTGNNSVPNIVKLMCTVKENNIAIDTFEIEYGTRHDVVFTSNVTDLKLTFFIKSNASKKSLILTKHNTSDSFDLKYIIDENIYEVVNFEGPVTINNINSDNAHLEVYTTSNNVDLYINGTRTVLTKENEVFPYDVTLNKAQTEVQILAYDQPLSSGKTIHISKTGDHASIFDLRCAVINDNEEIYDFINSNNTFNIDNVPDNAILTIDCKNNNGTGYSNTDYSWGISLNGITYEMLEEIGSRHDFYMSELGNITDYYIQIELNSKRSSINYIIVDETNGLLPSNILNSSITVQEQNTLNTGIIQSGQTFYLTNYENDAELLINKFDNIPSNVSRHLSDTGTNYTVDTQQLDEYWRARVTMLSTAATFTLIDTFSVNPYTNKYKLNIYTNVDDQNLLNYLVSRYANKWYEQGEEIEINFSTFIDKGYHFDPNYLTNIYYKAVYITNSLGNEINQNTYQVIYNSSNIILKLNVVTDQETLNLYMNFYVPNENQYKLSVDPTTNEPITSNLKYLLYIQYKNIKPICVEWNTKVQQVELINPS